MRLTGAFSRSLFGRKGDDRVGALGSGQQVAGFIPEFAFGEAGIPATSGNDADTCDMAWIGRFFNAYRDPASQGRLARVKRSKHACPMQSSNMAASMPP